MDIQPLDIAIHIVNIVVLFLILRLLVYKPVSKFMAERKARVQKEFDDASAARNEAEKLKEQYAADLANAGAAAEEQTMEILRKAKNDAETTVKNAQAEADEIIATARTKAKADTEKQIKDAQDEIEDLSLTIASRILSREVSEEDNHKIVQDFFADGTKA